MTSPTETSYRTRWNSQSHHTVVTENIEDWVGQITKEHLGDGWMLESKDKDTLVFSTHLQDGRKWTRHYDMKTCRFICQRFYKVENAANTVDWPSGSFGD